MSDTPIELRRFPVLWPQSTDRMYRFAQLECPKDVPWEVVAVHAGTIYLNHDQTLEELAERGGLEPSELIAAIEGRRHYFMHDEVAIPQLRKLLGLPKARRL